MNRTMYWFLLATTTFTPSTKCILDKRMKSLGLIAPKYNLAQVAEDAVSKDAKTKEAAIAKLNDASAFWYIKTDVATCEKTRKNLSKLRAKDFLKVHGAFNAVADVNFCAWNTGASFEIHWILNRKKAEALDKEA